MLSVLRNFIARADAETTVTVCAAAVLSLFAVALITTLFLKSPARSSRVWFLFFSSGVSALIFAKFAGTENARIGFVFLFATLITFSLIWALPVKRSIEKGDGEDEKRRALVRFIDEEIRKSKTGSAPAQSVTETVKARPLPTRRICPSAPDFSHVKSVIARLESFGLTQSEKKTVRDLELTVFEAESCAEEGLSDSLRVKVNEGLGSLLKIMAKYGV